MLLGSLTLLLTLLVAWSLYSPLRPFPSTGNDIAAEQPELQRLRDQKERCLQVLKDLELDFATKKLSEHDYEAMKRELALDLGGILEQLDAIRKS